MIFFSDRYTDGIRKLRETLDCLGMDAEVSVLEDEAFLPKGIFSPYEYYISKQNRNEHAQRELSYDSLSVPEYWEVREDGGKVGIYYMGCERAVVLLREGGNVCRVEWNMEDGFVYRVDFYNKYGLKYASEFRGADGNVDSRVYYSDGNQEVIVEQPGNDVVTLVENGMVKALFNSHREFLEHYVEEVSRNEKRAIFVQDTKMLENLEIKPDKEQAWDYVLLPNAELLNKYKNLGGKNGSRFYAIPRHYPENKAKGEALILTMSDQIERIEDLTNELPEMTFHIAANTLVSEKLDKLGERENVNIYPCVSREKLDELWDRCDFYLDVNHWYEIYDAVNVAHQNNLLILGFENTLHHPELLVKGCKFLAQDYKKMVLVIKYVMKSQELMQKLLLVQQRKAKVVWKEILQFGEEKNQG